ncbi:dihydroorotate dehydrogenase electron transfer subunit [Halolamina pelagica]|uniref:Dihydroorotate dehydrogenase electron transfer subunit n=1 Tax=Halolamina pelagica TaxID=699431 RepID=A0A0P7GQD3_9EURY|nr:FAD-dependent oxidoreductase [Halolamina pelagica]KPN30869.1 dihydroorotate dehydrogenase electron transfer subunit [Halolamina pelagica]
MDATVVDRESVGPDTFTLTFETPAGFEGLAGQFVRLSAEIDGESYARFYTLSSPDTEDTFEITVEVGEEGGPFSDYLAELSAGDEVAVAGPYGDEYYDGETRAVVLAGGPGVGAAVAISEAAIANDAEAAVVYQYDGEPAHTDRLDALVDAGADVTMLDAGDDAFAGAVEDALTTAAGEGVFVYGFAAFVETATDAIEAAGGDPDGANVESFG